MSESAALGHIGLMFGVLGLILMMYGVGRNLEYGYSVEGAFAWALITWGIGLAFVIAERLEASRTPGRQV